jgi:hypothetical protein
VQKVLVGWYVRILDSSDSFAKQFAATAVEISEDGDFAGLKLSKIVRCPLNASCGCTQTVDVAAFS